MIFGPVTEIALPRAQSSFRAFFPQHGTELLLVRQHANHPVDLHRFCGLFETENSARKGEHCHEQTRPTRRSFAEKLYGWLELLMRSTLSSGSPVRSVSPTAPFGVSSTKTRSTAVSEKG
jgi:hypothetical protein